jgi:hypothetical protein
MKEDKVIGLILIAFSVFMYVQADPPWELTLFPKYCLSFWPFVAPY